MSKDLYDKGKGETLTIASISFEKFTQRNGESVEKACVHWVEDRLPYACNATNLNWIIGTYGPQEQHWQGKKVFVFHDPTVKWGSDVVGGLVFDRPPSGKDQKLSLDLKKPLKKQLLIENQAEAPDDEIPF